MRSSGARLGRLVYLDGRNRDEGGSDVDLIGNDGSAGAGGGSASDASLGLGDGLEQTPCQGGGNGAHRDMLDEALAAWRVTLRQADMDLRSVTSSQIDLFVDGPAPDKDSAFSNGPVAFWYPAVDLDKRVSPSRARLRAVNERRPGRAQTASAIVRLGSSVDEASRVWMLAIITSIRRTETRSCRVAPPFLGFLEREICASFGIPSPAAIWPGQAFNILPLENRAGGLGIPTPAKFGRIAGLWTAACLRVARPALVTIRATRMAEGSLLSLMEIERCVAIPAPPMLKSNERWSAMSPDALELLLSESSCGEVAKVFGVSATAVAKKAARFGLRPQAESTHARRRRFT